MREIGRLMQMAGLAIPPVAMLYQLTSEDKHSLGIMLGLTIFAAALFWLGTMLGGRSRE